MGGCGLDPIGAGVEDQISLPPGSMPAILGSGHQEVLMFSSLSDGFKAGLWDLSLGLCRLKEVGSCSGSDSVTLSK